MEKTTKPVNKELLKAELTEDKRLRMTNKSNNQIYTIIHQNASSAVREIDRLREITSRVTGGGTSLPMDINEYDTMEYPYKRLVVWNPEAEEVLDGYRYLSSTDVRFDEKGILTLATSHMLHLPDAFIKEYLPQTIELGRSFITLEYRSIRTGSRGLFALDNLWDGLGALTVVMPNVKHFLDKVATYPGYHRHSRDIILHPLKKHFYDKEKLATPIKSLKLKASEDELSILFCRHSLREDHKILNREIHKLGYSIPPLVDVYMSLSPTMRMFRTAINYGFGDVEETGVLIAIDEILEDKRIRHIRTLIESYSDTLRLSSCEEEGVFIPKAVTPQVDCSR